MSSTTSKQCGTLARIPRFVKAGTAILVALVLFLAGTLVSYQPVGAAEIDKRDPRHAFYLTPLTYDGSQALNACEAGYHMASMWEILDPSNLRYDITLGLTREDSGFGPPQVFGGWVRTGGLPRRTVFIEGAANCGAWTSNSAEHEGTVVSLPFSWAGQSESRPIGPWDAGHTPCNSPVRVWCMQD